MVNNIKIKKKTDAFIREYLGMNIIGTAVSCPYWSNKLKEGKVVISGFLNGKGDAQSIKQELEKLLLKDNEKYEILSDKEKFRKFAKRNRIGIDCSGLVFRILNNIVDLSEIFKGGINKTSSNTLTSPQFCLKINKVKEIKPADLIRFNNGRHIALITKTTAEKIIYIHSSSISQIQGVHLGEIKIIDPEKGLEDQIFEELSKDGRNFGKKYFNPEKSDGIFRLKLHE